VAPGPTSGTALFERLMNGLGCMKGAPESDSHESGSQLPPIVGTADDIAQVVLWLCSEGASHLNGNVISADGGLDIVY
jgi:NAD(P)-dependent dehydrogenase (short-subunit alcohol dehydrogenase family)